jgi:hypothetical protein
MSISDFISAVLVLAVNNRWVELGAYLAVIQGWQTTNPPQNIPDLNEVKAGISQLRDLTIANQEALMSKNDEMNAKLDEYTAAVAAEIEKLKAAGTGGPGMSAEEVDAVIVRLQAAIDALKSGI